MKKEIKLDSSLLTAAILFPVVFVVLVFVNALTVYFVYNMLIPKAFGLAEITYMQGVCLAFLLMFFNNKTQNDGMTWLYAPFIRFILVTPLAWIISLWL